MALKTFTNAEMLAIANQTIARIRGKVVLTHKDGNTADIITTIISNAKTSAETTKHFAQYMRGAAGYGSGENTWKFVKKNIKYVLDPFGKQYIKSPAVTLNDRFADCKSYSIFIESVLRNLGIPCSFRFVSYSTVPTYTHVYVVAIMEGKEVILDCCMSAYNVEKPYNFKKDISMSEIYSMSGTEDNALGRALPTKMVKKVINLGSKPIDEMSEGEMDLYIARERMKAEKEVVEKMSGIGSVKAEKYQDSIDMLNDAIDAVQGTDADVHMHVIEQDIVAGKYSQARRIAGIGSIGKGKAARKAAQAQRKETRQQKVQAVVKKVQTATATVKAKTQTAVKTATTKTGAFVKKAAEKAKQGLKAVAKVVTAPQRLIVKALLEVTLPKAAPFFLYLFINDPKIIAKLPAKARNKRKKAEKISNFIVNNIGMKREHFMGIVRTGIIKQKGASPETILAKFVKGKISGVGFLPPGTIGAVIEIITKIVSFFNKKKEADMEVGENDAPSESDFEGMTEEEKTKLSTDVKKQTDTPAYENPGPSDLPSGGDEQEGGRPSTGGRKTWNSLGK